MVRIGHLDHDRLDLRQVQTRRHPVIKQSAVTKQSLLVVEVLLIKGPADALRHSPLQLPLDVTWMKCAARILRDRTSQNLHFAGIGIDLYIDTHRGERDPDCTSAIERCLPRDSSAGARKSAPA